MPSHTRSRYGSMAMGVALLAVPERSWLVHSLSTTRLQVCQNKDCRQRWPLHTPLPEVLHDLLDETTATSASYTIESTGCQSQCGRGPNVCVTSQGGETVEWSGLSSPLVVAAHLESLGTNVASQLVAAVNVLERAHNAVTVEEQERCVESVLNVWHTEQPARRTRSTVYYRARLQRAELYQASGRFDGALTDVQAVVDAVSDHPSMVDRTYARVLLARAHRIAANVHLHEGRREAAADALRNVMACNPTLRSKILLELERLQ